MPPPHSSNNKKKHGKRASSSGKPNGWTGERRLHTNKFAVNVARLRNGYTGLVKSSRLVEASIVDAIESGKQSGRPGPTDADSRLARIRGFIAKIMDAEGDLSAFNTEVNAIPADPAVKADEEPAGGMGGAGHDEDGEG